MSEQSDIPLNFVDACWKLDEKSDYKDLPDFVVNVKQEILDEEFSQSRKKHKIEQECMPGSDEQIDSKQFLILDDLKTDTTENEVLDEWNTIEEKFIVNREESSSTTMKMEQINDGNVDGYNFIKIEANLQGEKECSSISSNCLNQENGNDCDYQPLEKHNLGSHRFLPIKPAKGCKLQSNQCDSETNQECNLKEHQIKHPEEVKMFKCGQCEYKGTKKSYLRAHLLRHANPEEGKRFKCEKCDYQTVAKRNLKSHLFHHADQKEMFKCDKCNYQTDRNRNFRKHLQRHASLKEGTMLCEQCNYKTIKISHLEMHILRHNRLQ